MVCQGWAAAAPLLWQPHRLACASHAGIILSATRPHATDASPTPANLPDQRQIIVDLNFKDAFTQAKARPWYDALLAAVPQVRGAQGVD